MRHHLSGRKFSRPTGHRMLMLRGLATDLLKHESIKTTESKAREVQRIAEKAITLAKGGSLHQRRQSHALLTDDHVVKKLFDDVGPRFAERRGGYTRIIKLGPRKGDAAPMAMLELVP